MKILIFLLLASCLGSLQAQTIEIEIEELKQLETILIAAETKIIELENELAEAKRELSEAKSLQETQEQRFERVSKSFEVFLEKENQEKINKEIELWIWRVAALGSFAWGLSRR